MFNNPPMLTPRLSAVASQINNPRCFADIGTDHAYLPVYVCLTKNCKKAIAADIKKGPLSRAEKTIMQFGLENRIELRLGAGLDVLDFCEADVISIAGMGGIEITKILNDSATKIDSDTLIILQPMTSLPELRDYLYTNGWTIENELLAKEDDKIYNIIAVKHGNKRTTDPLSFAELYLGKRLIEKRPEHFEEYLQKQIEKTIKMIEGLKISKSEESQKKLEYCEELLDQLQKIRR